MYVYTPDGAPQAAWKPTITSVAANGDHFTLTGTQLTGLSAGDSYSHGAEMDTNYPIVELKSSTGKVYFARTFNWSSTGVPDRQHARGDRFHAAAGFAVGNVSIDGGGQWHRVESGQLLCQRRDGADVGVIRTGASSGYNEGDVIPFSFTVTNYGPANATKVVVTDTLGSNLSYSSATTTVGTAKSSGNVLTFSIGALAVGQTATITVYAQATEEGTLSQTAVVTGKESDPNSLNNTAVNSVTADEPPIVVSGPITVSGKNQSNVLVATFTHARRRRADRQFHRHDRLGRWHDFFWHASPSRGRATK